MRRQDDLRVCFNQVAPLGTSTNTFVRQEVFSEADYQERNETTENAVLGSHVLCAQNALL